MRLYIGVLVLVFFISCDSSETAVMRCGANSTGADKIIFYSNENGPVFLQKDAILIKNPSFSEKKDTVFGLWEGQQGFIEKCPDFFWLFYR